VLGQVAKEPRWGAGTADGASALTQYLFTGKVDWRQVDAASIGGAVADGLSGGVGGLEVAGAIVLESGDGAVINALSNVIGGEATEAVSSFLGADQGGGVSGGTAAALDFVLGFAGTKVADRFIPAAIEKNWIAARRHLQQGIKLQNLATQRARAFRVGIVGSVFAATAGETASRLNGRLELLDTPRLAVCSYLRSLAGTHRDRGKHIPRLWRERPGWEAVWQRAGTIYLQIPVHAALKRFCGLAPIFDTTS
jgi:hypothetical protein